MNERIQKLAKQAGLTMNNPLAYEQWYLDSLEKFAELIVKECVDTISDCSIEYCTRPQIVSEIKQHFGVEE